MRMTAEGDRGSDRRLLFLTGPSRNRLALRQFLTDEVGEVEVVYNDERLDHLLSSRRGTYDAVLVDLPPGERVYLCARLRSASDAAVLVIGDPNGIDAASCLDAGADDYVLHPDRVHEVAARVRARIRRAPATSGRTRILEAGGVRMDLDRHEVEIDARSVALPLKQFRLLEMLVANAGQVVSSRAIIEHMWGPLERVDRNTVQAHVARLRQTLGDEDVGRRIRAVPGIGYTFPR